MLLVKALSGGLGWSKCLRPAPLCLFVTALLGIPVTPLAAAPRCGDLPATIVGTDGPDRIRGTDGDDVIVARAGADHVTAGRGVDRICGGSAPTTSSAGVDEMRSIRGGDTMESREVPGETRCFRARETMTSRAVRPRTGRGWDAEPISLRGAGLATP